MTFDYKGLQKVAGDIIKKFEQGTLTLVRTVINRVEPWQSGPKVQSGGVLNGTVNGVSAKYIEQSLAQTGDLQATITYDENLIPVINDSVDIDGDLYKILQVISKPAAGDPVVFVLILRR